MRIDILDLLDHRPAFPRPLTPYPQTLPAPLGLGDPDASSSRVGQRSPAGSKPDPLPPRVSSQLSGTRARTAHVLLTLIGLRLPHSTDTPTFVSSLRAFCLSYRASACPADAPCALPLSSSEAVPSIVHPGFGRMSLCKIHPIHPRTLVHITLSDNFHLAPPPHPLHPASLPVTTP
ncbi:hypothetical protein FRC08_016187 [Ceratobasidium sp. 394]|nr:hypothetical protein FRC08_016187 [Ceratobasidium sp. 394]